VYEDLQLSEQPVLDGGKQIQTPNISGRNLGSVFVALILPPSLHFITWLAFEFEFSILLVSLFNART